MRIGHHICCEFWVDQYSWECTCGSTAERASWFDKVEQDYAARLAADKSPSGKATQRALSRHVEKEN